MNFNTLATPHKEFYVLKKQTHNIIQQTEKIQEWCRIATTTLFSQPELSKAVRELSKLMEEANMSHYKAIIHKIKYLIDTNILLLPD